MCNLNNQTSLLMDRPTIIPPVFIQPLINAYVISNQIHSLDFGVLQNHIMATLIIVAQL
jgi:hypothetical protein